ncbi:MAG: dephospho-CoA kinase [Phascolarctobacterium sp.]|nr:dephospho-CoA kinase [Phascolarctobacterium sp.]
MIIIGLTGGIASGKSSVSKELSRLGIAVHDADLVSRQVVAKGSDGLKEIVKVFGEQFLTQEGELNRPMMAQLVFNDQDARSKLNHIVHAAVREDRDKFLQAHQNDKIVVLDVPLLIETGLYKEVDKVWLVVVSEAEQIKRAMLRDNFTEEQVKARIKAQLPFEEKAMHADLIIDNSGKLEDTIAFVHQELAKLLGE